MLRTHLLLALRAMRRQPGYAGINVLGLAVGIACCLLIALYVRHELAHDQHHERGHRIARVASIFSDEPVPVTGSIVGPVLAREVPQVEATVRLFNIGTFQSVVVRTEDRMFEESHFFYADSTVFDVFTLPLASGVARTALTRPRTVVLTDPAARRYFPAGDPVGKTLMVDEVTYEVTGVLAPLPAATHLSFDFLASFTSLGWATREIWTSANFATYALLRPDASFADASRQIERLVERARTAGDVHPTYSVTLQPLRSLHLDAGGRRIYVYLFSAIAALILLIACVNYMNLATARATQRGREVGVRKALGARHGQLVSQFYSESALLALVSVAVAAGLALALLPAFRGLSGQPLVLDFGDPFVVALLLAAGGVAMIVSGSYPALLLSSFGPIQALRGTLRTGPGGIAVRRGLVVFQFAVSVFLLAATAIVFSQLRYFQTVDLGFHGEQVVALPIGDDATAAELPALKRRLALVPGVTSLAAIDRIPGRQTGVYGLSAEGFDLPDGMRSLPITGVPTEPGIARTLGLQVIAGGDLAVPEGYQPEPGEYVYLVNEATVRALGWSPEEAIGRRMSVSGDPRAGTIAGVIRDYHYLPMHEPVGPLALFVEPTSANNLLIRLDPGAAAGVLAAVDAIWKEFVPHRPFTYTFLDQAFAAHYERERQLGRLFGGFSLLAVLIACLGLLGLAAYAAERRRREIGVRKVLGARTSDIVSLLSREFAVLVAIGFALAAPLAHLAMDRWLQQFAYRVEVGLGVFVATGVVVLLLALAVVSAQAVRAATADPVQALRSD